MSKCFGRTLNVWSQLHRNFIFTNSRLFFLARNESFKGRGINLRWFSNGHNIFYEMRHSSLLSCQFLRVTLSIKGDRLSLYANFFQSFFPVCCKKKVKQDIRVSKRRLGQSISGAKMVTIICNFAPEQWILIFLTLFSSIENQ